MTTHLTTDSNNASKITIRSGLSDTSDMTFAKDDLGQAIINELNDTANTTFSETKLPDINKYQITTIPIRATNCTNATQRASNAPTKGDNKQSNAIH